MPLNVSGSDSLYWRTGLDNSGLMVGATQTKGIIRNLVRTIGTMDLFAVFGFIAARRLKRLTEDVYRFSKDFEHSMKEVQTISKAVQKDFKGISDEIMQMSTELPEGAINLSKALYQIVSAGYDGARAMELLRISAELAIATVTDTFTAADALTYVMNAYGTAAGTALEVSDKLFTIIKLGKVTMEELGPTISMVTGLAAEAGMSFNDLAAFYAEAVKKIKPHIVSTGIRGFVTALLRASKEGQQAADAAKEMGIEFDIATMKSKGLWYMLNQMSIATKGQKQKLMELFPNVRGLIGLLAIMTNEGQNFNDSLNQIVESTGNMRTALQIMVEDSTNQLKILKNNVIAELKPFGDELIRFAGSVAYAINKMFEAAQPPKLKTETLEYYRKMFEAIKPGKVPIGPTGEKMWALAEISPPDVYIRKLKEEGIEIENLRVLLEKLLDVRTSEEERLNIINTLSIEATKAYMRETKKLEELTKAYDDTKIAWEKLQEEKGKVPVFFGASKEEMEEFTQKMIEMHEKQLLEDVELDEMYKDWKISSNKELLRIEIEQLEEYMSRYDEEHNFKLGLIDELKRRKEQLQKLEIEGNKATLNEIIKDTRGWGKQELQIYAKFLQDQAELWQDNEAMHKTILEKYSETMQKVYDAEITKIKEIGDVFNALGDLVSKFDSDLGNAIGKAGVLAGSIVQMMTAKTGVGQFAGSLGVMGSYLSIMQTLTAGDDTRYKKQLEYLSKLNYQTEKQIRLLRQLTGLEALEGMVDLFGNLNAEIEANLNTISDIKIYNKLGQAISTLGEKFTRSQLENLNLGSDIMKKDRELYKDLIKTLDESRTKLKEFETDYRELITATTVPAIADSIADGFLQGFKVGKDELGDFAANFEDTMRNALINTFKQAIISEMLEDWYEEFAYYIGAPQYGIESLSVTEIEKLRTGFEEIIRGATSRWATIIEIARSAGLEMDNVPEIGRTGLTGAIAGITEQTAGLLAGQFNAIRMTNVKMLDQLENINDGKLMPSLTALWEIRNNTYSLPNIMRTMNDMAIDISRTADNTDYLISIDEKLNRLPTTSDWGRVIGA